jgi:V8-like Glu-specific endopeptidase
MDRSQLTMISLRTSLTLGAVGFIAACGSTPTDRAIRRVEGPNGLLTFVSSYRTPDTIEKIIGSNELTPVIQDGANIPSKYRPLIDAFGKISMGCTATHIGQGLVITAGHCFDAPEKRINNRPCDKVTVEWGYRKDKAPYMKSNCTMILAAELNDNRDYAIFRVSPVPPVSVEMDLSVKPKIGSTLTIFGHPQLRPLEWSQTCTLENPSNGGWGTDEFSHQCDTEPGNSGSTILDDSTLKIIGIHDGGRVPWNYGTYIVNTPVREFIGDVQQPNPIPVPTSLPVPQPTAQPSPQPSDTVISLQNRYFGPFWNNDERTLVSYGADVGHSMSFELSLNTEANADFVTLVDGDGHTTILSGNQTRVFEKLPLPVKISFKSDRTVRSKKVLLRKVIAYQ